MRGRPRDPDLDARIREHALDLLLERGIEGTTMDEVAARAGAGKASVYRRWSSMRQQEIAADSLERARRRGELRADVTDETVVDQLMGPILTRVVTGRPLPAPEGVPHLVDLALRGIGAP